MPNQLPGKCVELSFSDFYKQIIKHKNYTCKMPTIIALDVSLSMQRTIPGRSDHTYHQLALKGISQLLDYLAIAKLEYVSLLTFSAICEIKVDFTRDYDLLRQAAKKVEPGDKSCLLSMLKNTTTICIANWGTQSYCQIVVFTDCGIGFGTTALKAFMQTPYANKEPESEYAWLKLLKLLKLNFICMGLHSDSYFTRAVAMYQQLIDFASLKGQLFMTKPAKDATYHSNGANDGNTNSTASSSVSHTSHKSELGRTAMFELVERVCETCYRPYETVLKCGGYFRLESPVYIWPPPISYLNNNDKLYTLAQKMEVCGFISLSDIGSPASLSRHLVLPKVEREKPPSRRSSDKSSAANKTNSAKVALDINQPNYEYEKMEQDIRDFYSKEGKDTDESGDDAAGDTNKANSHNDQKETLCVLLHGALKAENLAALVLLNENWYGFIYVFTDTKKKSNLMLNVLPRGSNVIPWLGDLQQFGLAEDLPPGETSSFPVKSEKRSYSQSCVVWIRQASLQSDVQKVLRHAKKMPDKTQHFYKELNRIRRAALSIGFVELLEALATLLDKEATHMTVTTECTLQLKHAALELRKLTNRDLKVSIQPLQKYGSGGGTDGTAPGYTY